MWVRSVMWIKSHRIRLVLQKFILGDGGTAHQHGHVVPGQQGLSLSPPGDVPDILDKELSIPHSHHCWLFYSDQYSSVTLIQSLHYFFWSLIAWVCLSTQQLGGGNDEAKHFWGFSGGWRFFWSDNKRDQIGCGEGQWLGFGCFGGVCGFFWGGQRWSNGGLFYPP